MSNSIKPEPTTISESSLSKFNQLKADFDIRNVEDFYAKVCQLAESYKKRESAVRQIYFNAYSFLVGCGNYAAHAAMFYLRYLNAPTPSPSFRHRSIGKELRPLLFKDKITENKFLQICERLKTDKDLEKALKETQWLYRLARKEIQLDATALQETNRKQAEIADILGKYLADEDETPHENIPVEMAAQEALFLTEDAESGLFLLFEQHNYTLNTKEIDTFVRGKGLFRDGFVQQINEKYFDDIDDTLIESTGDVYLLNRQYYEQIRKWQ